MYSQLQHSDLKKFIGTKQRLDIFIDKIVDGDYFLTTKGAVKLDMMQKINNTQWTPKELKSLMGKGGFTATFAGRNEKNVVVKVDYPKDFLKNEDFGGKGKGSGTIKEDAALRNFRSEIQSVRDKFGLPYVPIKVNGRVVNAVDVVSTPGTPKSDFHLIDPSGKSVAWFSHKDGTTAKEYQQYGGLTELSKKFPNHKEIMQFIDDVKTASGGALASGTSYMRPLKDKEVAKAAIYGIDYDSGRPGIQNVDLLLQGKIKLVQNGNVWNIDSAHTIENDDIPTGGYTPQLFVRKGDRSNFGIGNARFMIAPMELKRGTTKPI
jgi:hypothetical protein